MKVPFKLTLNFLAVICLLWAMPAFAQTNSRDYKRDANAKPLRPFSKARAAAPIQKNQPTFASACDNDLTAPEIHCAAGNCLPNARAAYLVSTYGEPWGQSNNLNAMDAVFGSGNWDYFNLEYADANTLFSTGYKVIFLEGSEYGGYALDAFLSAQLPALENWVAAGGALFLNCGPNSAPTVVNLGFGGVYLENPVYSGETFVQTPTHPIFNTPYAPAYANFTGNYFAHAVIQGPAGTVLISDAYTSNALLTEKNWGSGKVYFGGMTIPYYHTPQYEAQNMRQNILADLNNLCSAGIIVAADAGACSATVLDQVYDATATDDCALASLTHDFAAAPVNTTLSGAVLPAGLTLVRWTATDATGNSSTCETLLSVRESEAPAVQCPADIFVSADAGLCGAVLSFAVSATDNCTANPNIVSNPASGSTFSLGSTTVVATASDASYNHSTCVFTVNVTPNPEICNGIDDDCNGWVDDGAVGDGTFYADNDGDGYGNPNQSIVAPCPPPYGYVFNAGDCDDNNYYIQPGMYEICNGVDDNCDGNIDEGVAPTWYSDADGDGYGDQSNAQVSCDQPQGFVSNSWDCADNDAYIHPGALEDCTNLVDENCDGILGDNNFTINETHTDVFCGSNPDGAISITVTPAQNYPVTLWSNGICCTTDVSSLDFGMYKVTVTNECGTSKTKTVMIEPAAEPALQVSLSGTDFICGGAGDGSITAVASDGCGGYTYEWSTGSTDAVLSGLGGGVYTVVATDACGCTRSGSFTVNEPGQLSLYFATVIPLLDGTYFIQVYPNGGNAPYQFRHSTPPSGYTNWSSSNGFINVAPGDYVFEVQDATGCTAQAQITLDPLAPRPLDGDLKASESADRNASTSTMEMQVQVTLFPNPNTGNFRLDLLQAAPENMSFGITDQSGKLLMEKQIEAGSQLQSVNAETLPAGLYFLQVMSGAKVVAVEKFIKA